MKPDQAFARLQNAARLLSDSQVDAADAECLAVLRHFPANADALHFRGIIEKRRGRFSEAEQCFLAALKLIQDAPARSVVLSNLSNCYAAFDRIEPALEAAQQALAANPDNANAHNNLGHLYLRLKRYQEAIPLFERAVALNPADADAWNNLGASLQQLGRLPDALRCFEQSLSLKPNAALAHFNQGNLFMGADLLDRAIDSYQKALAADPNYVEALTSLLRMKQMACDWDGLDVLEARVRHLLQSRQDGRVYPFAFLALDATPGEQLECSRQWARAQYLPLAVGKRLTPRPGGARERLRIGYLSSDLHDHATAFLAAELFELHDKQRFEIIAYSAGADDGKAMRQRLIKAFDRFVDVEHWPPDRIAQRIHDDEIDILVDLKGYTTNTRSSVLAYRPAPVQLQYIGYPGSLGMADCDYLITDRFVTPLETQEAYDEKFAILPHCYQPNDRRRRIAPSPTRAECGLPEDAFVFCCFNHTYKITPGMFGLWCDLLLETPRSVLWLLKSNPWAEGNLRRFAATRGIAPDRIVFGDVLPLDRHLGRLQLADLFLDTYPVVAHTTASDALWAGVPVLTKVGQTFISRVAGSLLQAVGLPSLIAGSDAEYLARARALVSQPAELADLKAHLREARDQQALWNTPAYTRALEALYQEMWRIYSAGLPPRHLNVGSVRPAAAKPAAGNVRSAVEIVAATRMSESAFWEQSPLGRSLQRLRHDTRFILRIAFENTRGLPEIYNAVIDQPADTAASADLLLFVHDDVYLDDYFIADLLPAGLQQFDVIGVAGNTRRVPRQPAWLFNDDRLTLDREYLSGSVGHGKTPFGAVSCYGHTGLACEFLDGVLLATRRSTLLRAGVRFDPQFRFHFYDMDFCRTARAANLRLGTWPLAITHTSAGLFGSPAWREMLALYRAKWPD